MQNQLVCSGCRSVLLYPRGATNVCCALCNTITSVPPPGMEMAQLICGGCRTLLMYTRGATSVRCSCCHTVNLAPASNQVAHVNCGNCRTTLMYPYGAPSVKCAVCHFVTNVGTASVRVPIPVHRPNGTTNPGTIPSTSTVSSSALFFLSLTRMFHCICYCLRTRLLWWRIQCLLMKVESWLAMLLLESLQTRNDVLKIINCSSLKGIWERKLDFLFLFFSFFFFFWRAICLYSFARFSMYVLMLTSETISKI